ncbi:MAG: hypothetical protein ACQES0_03855 [Bacteroidota bacterium]
MWEFGQWWIDCFVAYVGAPLPAVSCLPIDKLTAVDGRQGRCPSFSCHWLCRLHNSPEQGLSPAAMSGVCSMAQPAAS